MDRIRARVPYALALAFALAACRDAPPAPAPASDVAVAEGRAEASARVGAGASAETRAVEVSEPNGPFTWVAGEGREDAPIAYELVEPSNATPRTPIVIALHGMGDKPAGFAKLAGAIGARARWVVARGTIAWPESGGFKWYELEAPDSAEQIGLRAKDVVTLARQLHERYPEAGKPALLGFSQGAAIALQAAFDHPDEWRAILAFSGYLASAADPKAPTVSYPILVSAGTEDDRIEAKLSWFAAGWLSKAGHADVRKLEFEGGHTVPKEVVSEARKVLDEVFAR